MPRGGSNKYTWEEFVALAQQKHVNELGEPLYTYNPIGEYDPKKKVSIVCPKPGHGTFEKHPAKHLFGQGCQKCSRSGGRGRSLSTEEFIARARKIHGDKYDYSSVVYENNSTLVTIICRVPGHKPFRQVPTSHIDGRNGCPTCGHVRVGLLSRSNTEEFVEKARKVHGDKYSYEYTKYTTSKEPVKISCPHHKVFEQMPNDHLAGYGCRDCGFERSAEACRKSIETFIGQAKQIHGDACSYGNVKKYVNQTYKVPVTCERDPTHGDFPVPPKAHLIGQGCPKCNRKGHSRMSIEWLEHMSKRMGRKIRHAENGGEFKLPGTKYTVDGYIADLGMVLEFHGDYWHGNPKYFEPEGVNTRNKKTFGELYESTLRKKEYILKAGYTYMEIWESDWLDVAEQIKKWKPGTYLSITLWREKLTFSEPFVLTDPGF